MSTVHDECVRKTERDPIGSPIDYGALAASLKQHSFFCFCVFLCFELKGLG